MIQEIKRALAVGAATAALALTAATPASADEHSEPVAIGTVWEAWDKTGGSATLYSGATTCTDIPALAGVRSAQNNADSGYVMRFFTDFNCQSEAGPALRPGQDTGNNGGHLMNWLPVAAYTITPV